MRLLPRSLAGRLAALLVVTLVVAQAASLMLFAGERVAAFRTAYKDDLIARLASLVDLLAETPPALRQRIVATTSSPMLILTLDAAPELPEGSDAPTGLRDSLAAAVDRPAGDVRVAFPLHDWRRPTRRNGEPQSPAWAAASIRIADDEWLNARAGRAPVPPIGHAFLLSFLVTAAAVAAVGALGVRWASRPLRSLAAAADRLGRGESFEPLPERGPQETRQANIAFNRMRERLDRFVRNRTAMLAAIAHDLRTPITSLRLRAEFVDDEEHRTRILETLAEMQAMTEAVLAFARSDAESEPTRPTDVAALVESVVVDLAETGRDARFVDSPPAVLPCRPAALKRAVTNVVENAVFHGGSCRVRVETRGEAIDICVDDDGPGLPAEDMERVFEPFVRLEGSRSRDTGGAGLGLAIARSILRGHGGDIRLENRSEGGLSATLSLPRGG